MKQVNELTGKCYFYCTACMSVWADALSWANANIEKITKAPILADNIIIPSCQVTDLAILNDFKVAEKFKKDYPDKNIFISGCLSNREDIEFPEGIQRLNQMRCNYQHINDKSLVKFAKPFWVKDYDKNGNELSAGNLFRNKYPLRIGKGCPFNCDYCTINVTRGAHESYVSEKLIEEFLRFPDVLLIADSPTVSQIKDWCKIAINSKKEISIRNIEPQVAMKCKEELTNAALHGVLNTFHCPIQSYNEKVLIDMKRHVQETFDVVVFARFLKSHKVTIATNIIVDYKDFQNEFDAIYQIYDYVSWNPLWDGVWNIEVAEKRFKHYLNG